MELATTYYHLGVLYMKQHQEEAAVIAHKKAVEIRELKAPMSLDLASSYAWLGVVCDERNRLEDALVFYEKAKCIEEFMAPDSLFLATTYSKIGFVYFKQDRMDDALRFYNKALVIREEKAPDSLVLATTYNNLAVVFENKSELVLARRSYERVLEIGKSKAFDALEMAKIYAKLGAVCEKQKKLGDALHHYEEALSIRNGLAPESLDVAVTCICLGDVYHKQYQIDHDTDLPVHERQQKLDKANHYYNMARAIQEQHAPDMLDLASTLTKLGSVLLLKAELTTATAHFDQAIVIYHSNGVSSGIELAKAHHGEGLVLAAMGLTQLALEQFHLARGMLEELDQLSMELAQTYHGMADVFYNTEADDDAIRYYRLALDIYRKHDTKTRRISDIQVKLETLKKAAPVVLDAVGTARAKLQIAMSSTDAEPAELPLEYVDLITTDKKLGEGFFGTVFEGCDHELQTKFAVKVIHDHLLEQENMRDIEYAKKTFQHEIEVSMLT
jgi:tetratricopeptide (TPR) repeat protein